MPEDEKGGWELDDNEEFFPLPEEEINKPA